MPGENGEILTFLLMAPVRDYIENRRSYECPQAPFLQFQSLMVEKSGPGNERRTQKRNPSPEVIHSDKY